jgi:putative endonuclease
VGPRKRERLRRTAELWLAEHDTPLQPRFDVIEIYAPDGTQTKSPRINHIENAF